MTLSRVGEPFKGVGYYWVETSYGGGETTVTNPISCKIQNVRVGTGDRFKVLRGINSPLACHFLDQPYEPTLHLEYIPQCDDTLMADVINRSSCATLQSLAFEFGANICDGITDSDNKTWYMITGAKPRTVSISASKSNEYLVTIDFECCSIATSSTPTGSEPTSGSTPALLTGDYLAFNLAGSITKTGGHVVNTDQIAFFTNAIDLTFTHQLTSYTDHDTKYKGAIIEGTMDVEGSVDITLDGGGGFHFGEAWRNVPFDLVVNMGDTGCPIITLEGCQWKNSEAPIDLSGEAMIESAGFTCKPSSVTSIVSPP